MNGYKQETYELCRTKGWDKAHVSTVWLLFTEEIGELASAIRQFQRSFRKTGLKKERGTDVMTEMGDVFSYLFQLAYMLDVNLDEMWLRHKQKVQDRSYGDAGTTVADKEALDRTAALDRGTPLDKNISTQ
jgi:NTP pyrophosphatase (non-canonical NTP hydrolase)